MKHQQGKAEQIILEYDFHWPQNPGQGQGKLTGDAQDVPAMSPSVLSLASTIFPPPVLYLRTTAQPSRPSFIMRKSLDFKP